VNYSRAAARPRDFDSNQKDTPALLIQPSTTSKSCVISAVLPSMMLAEQYFSADEADAFDGLAFFGGAWHV
jgi:hypothetical protein